LKQKSKINKPASQTNHQAEETLTRPTTTTARNTDNNQRIH
jgi:hypothetical protein